MFLLQIASHWNHLGHDSRPEIRLLRELSFERPKEWTAKDLVLDTTLKLGVIASSDEEVDPLKNQNQNQPEE